MNRTNSDRRRVTVLGLAVGLTFLAACTSSREQSGSTSLPGPSTSSGASTIGASTTDVATTIADTTTTTPAPATVPETTTTGVPTTTTEPPTTTTLAPLVTEGAVVKVANATNIDGGAAKMTEKLGAAGYHISPATNSAGSEEFRDVTIIYFLPGGEAVATSVAMVMGVSLARMPTPAPITDATAGLGDAKVLVMLGRDLVGKTPPGLTGR